MASIHSPRQAQPSCNTGRSLARCDSDHTDTAGNVDIVTPGAHFVVRGLQLDIVAHIAEGLVIEDECRGPALEVDASGNACWTVNGDLRSSSTDPYGNLANGRREFQANRAESSLNLQSGEIEPAQFGGDVRCSAFDDDSPWDGDIECDLSRTFSPVHHP